MVFLSKAPFGPGVCPVSYLGAVRELVLPGHVCYFRCKILKWLGVLDSAGLVHSRNLQVLHKFIFRCSLRCHLLPSYEETM